VLDYSQICGGFGYVGVEAVSYRSECGPPLTSELGTGLPKGEDLNVWAGGAITRPPHLVVNLWVRGM
jgi:hypothetical protein